MMNVSQPEAGGGRRTRSKVLRAVEAEVELMLAEPTSGPASLLRDRLAARGVKVTEATLRSGDCRPLLEKVWVRRPRSTRYYGPTGGHDLRPVEHLVDHIIDLEAKIARVNADLRGEATMAANREMDARAVANWRKQRAAVAENVAMIPEVIAHLSRSPVDPTFITIAKEFRRRGRQMTSTQLYRHDEYSTPIWRFLGKDKPIKPEAPGRAMLMRKEAEELGAMVFRLLDELRELEARFEATLT